MTKESSLGQSLDKVLRIDAELSTQADSDMAEVLIADETVVGKLRRYTHFDDAQYLIHKRIIASKQAIFQKSACL